MLTLIVVDMINDFVHPAGNLLVKKAYEIVPEINRLIAENDLVIFAEDAHDENDKEFKQFPEHAVKGDWGSKRYFEINTPSLYVAVEKKTFSAFSNPKLIEFLNKWDVHDLKICGVVTEICVLETALDAKKYNLSTWVDLNTVCSFDPIKGQQAIERMASEGVKFII